MGKKKKKKKKISILTLKPINAKYYNFNLFVPFQKMIKNNVI